MKFGLALLVLGLVAFPLAAYEPNSTSPYTFNGTYSCSPCEIYSHTKVGDGFHHDSGCDQSGYPLYFCTCSIGYSGSLMLAQPVLRVVDNDSVELEYFTRNAYCNPPADIFSSNEPNAIPYRISVVAINPQTMNTISTVHVIPPYWEHGKIQMDSMDPVCTMYRAVYAVDTGSTTYAVSSDLVGGTGGSSCAPLPDLGPCPTCNGGSGTNPGGVSPGAGGPVNVGSGNMYYNEPLFRVDEPGSALDFNVTYNSLETNAGPLGPGFTHTVAESMVATNNMNIRVWRKADGTRVVFARENHPPIGEYWRPIYPGDATGSVIHDGSAGRYKWTALNGTVTEVDDSAGLWRKTTDRWGNTLTATYTGSNLTSVADSLGRTWTLAYSGSLLTSITDGDSNQWRFSYDGSNRLEKIFDPLHTSTTPWRQFTWTTYATGKSAVATITDESGAVLEGHQYDSSGRATSSWSGDTSGSPPAPGTNARNLVTLSYDSATQTTVTTKIDSGVTQNAVYTLKAGAGRFLATSIVGSCGSCGVAEDAQTFTFDDDNHVLTKTVGLNLTGSGGTDERVTSSYTYNTNGMMLTATQAVGKTEEHTTTYAYGQSNWPSFITSMTEASVAKSGQSKTTTYAWNSGETVLTTTATGYLRSTDTSATSYVTTTTFDSRHRATQADGPRTNQKTTWTYYSDTDSDLNRRGRLHTMNGYSTTSAALTNTLDDYDVYGNAGLRTDPNGVDTALTFDARGRVLTATSVQPTSDSAEPADYVTTHVYDGRDRLTSTTFPRGNLVRYAYEDGTNRLLSTIRADSGGDEHERLLLTLNTIGRKTSEAAQDCNTPADPCTAWTTRRSDAFAYDTSGRLSTITHPDSSFIARAYDSRGNLTGVRDERHSAANTLYSYDFRNRRKSVTQKRTIVSGSDVVTQYAYDDQDDLVSVTDPKSNVTTYSFDDFGRVQIQSSPVSGTTSNTYDAAGNKTSTTDANSATTARTFDLLNRVLTATSTRTSLPTETVTWTYDDATAGSYGKGRIASMDDPSGTTTYQYERRGLLRQESNSDLLTGVDYAYDANGNRIYMSGIDYTFDFADRPDSAAWAGSTIADGVTYLPFGPLNGLTYGNGAVKTTTYDSRYRPTENKLTRSSTTIADYVYDQDDASNITEISDAVDATYDRDFAYDDLNRLITANSGSSLWGTGSYSYDDAGSITSLSLGSTRNLTFSYVSTTSKLSSVNSNSVSYDSAGNEEPNISARNLVSLDNAHYVYDGRGVRVYEYLGLFETSLPYSRTYLYSPELHLLGFSHDSALFPGTTSIIWLGDMPLAQLSSRDYYPNDLMEGDLTYFRYTFTDHLGTPILQMMGSDVFWQAEYEPYGSIFLMRTSNGAEQPLRLPGQEAIEDNDGTAKAYNIFRWYRAGWGRFSQSDPLPPKSGTNAYSYADDDPVDSIDPLGLFTTDCPCKTGKAKQVHDAMDDIAKKAETVPWPGLKKCWKNGPQNIQKIICAKSEDCQFYDFDMKKMAEVVAYSPGQGTGTIVACPKAFGSQCGLVNTLAHEQLHDCFGVPDNPHNDLSTAVLKFADKYFPPTCK